MLNRLHINRYVEYIVCVRIILFKQRIDAIRNREVPSRIINNTTARLDRIIRRGQQLKKAIKTCSLYKEVVRVGIRGINYLEASKPR